MDFVRKMYLIVAIDFHLKKNIKKRNQKYPKNKIGTF